MSDVINRGSCPDQLVADDLQLANSDKNRGSCPPDDEPAPVVPNPLSLEEIRQIAIGAGIRREDVDCLLSSTGLVLRSTGDYRVVLRIFAETDITEEDSEIDSAVLQFLLTDEENEAWELAQKLFGDG